MPLNCASGSVSGAKPSKNHASPFNYAGRRKGRGNDVGPTHQRQQPNCSAFSFPFIVVLDGRGTFFNFNPRRQLQPSSPFNFQTPSLFYFLPFSLMATMCLMQLLPDDLVTKIIIHSIKDEPVFHFLNLHNKICGTFQRICDSDEVLLHVLLCDLHRVIKNPYIRS
jgi:hypothetical protein